MANFIGTAPTLLGISVNDFIIWGGTPTGRVAVASVVSAVTNTDRTITAVITITGGAQLTLKTSNTVIQEFYTDAAGQGHAVWVYSS